MGGHYHVEKYKRIETFYQRKSSAEVLNRFALIHSIKHLMPNNDHNNPPSCISYVRYDRVSKSSIYRRPPPLDVDPTWIST